VRVLLIHQAFCGPNDPGGTRHYELGRRLVGTNHRLTVITSRYSYLTGERKSPPSLTHGIEVHLAATLGGSHRSYFRRILGFVIFTISSFFAALGLEKPDVVVGTSPPIFQAISAWAIATTRRRPFVLEIRDLWPEFAIELGLLRSRILISIARSLERFLYRHSSHIIVNSPAYLDYLLPKGVPKTKITVIPNGVEMSSFHADETGKEFRRQFELEDKFVVMYAGAIGWANDVDCLLRSAARLRDEPQIVFVVVGNGKELPRLRQESESQHVDNLRFVPAQPKEAMSNVLAAADVCVATLRNIPMFRTTYPNKVFDYMAAGRPTLLAIDGAIRDVIERSGGGLFVPPGDDHSLTNAILKLHNSPALRKEMGDKARKYVAANFNRETQARQLIILLERICEGQTPQVTSLLR
jgi:glycosyltransferase involved in cell wall biosynthesis